MNQYTDDERKAAKKWLEANGMTFIDKDFGPRFQNGESATITGEDRDRIGDEWVLSMADVSTLERDSDHAPNRFDEGTSMEPVWRPRNAQERAVVEALDDFREQYLAHFEDRQAFVDFMYARDKSIGDIAAEQGITKQAVSQARKRMLASVTRSLSRYWPDPEGTDEQRAWAVFSEWWRERFGSTYPNVNGAAGSEFVGLST